MENFLLDRNLPSTSTNSRLSTLNPPLFGLGSERCTASERHGSGMASLASTPSLGTSLLLRRHNRDSAITAESLEALHRCAARH